MAKGAWCNNPPDAYNGIPIRLNILGVKDEKRNTANALRRSSEEMYLLEL
jgi:hypothetical protein